MITFSMGGDDREGSVMKEDKEVLIETTSDLVSTALSKCGFSTDRPPKTPEEKRMFASCLKKEASAFMEFKGTLPLGDDAVDSVTVLEITADRFLKEEI